MLKKQSGAVLIVSLIILIVLTLLVLSGTQSTLMQEKMTVAQRDGRESLEIAESGLLDAEKMIDSLTDISGFTATNGVVNTGGKYSVGAGPTDIFADSVWADNLTFAGTVKISGDVVSRYFVEYIGTVSASGNSNESDLNINGYGETSADVNVHAFKIVTRSVGAKGNTERVIVSYYGKNF